MPSTNHPGKLTLGGKKAVFILGWGEGQPDRARSIMSCIRCISLIRTCCLSEKAGAKKGQERTWGRGRTRPFPARGKSWIEYDQSHTQNVCKTSPRQPLRMVGLKPLCLAKLCFISSGLFYFCLCVLGVGCTQRPEDMVSPRADVTGSSKPPGMGAGN